MTKKIHGEPSGEAVGAVPVPRAAAFPMVELSTTDPDVRGVFDTLGARGASPPHIHRVIAHAPKIYAGYYALASALRETGSSPRSERELCILRTVSLRGGEYEYLHHRRIGRACGLSDELMDAIPDWRGHPAFTARQRALLALTDEMVAEGEVSEPTMARARELFSLEEIVELAMTSAFYTAVVQVSRALNVQPETAPNRYGEPGA